MGRGQPCFPVNSSGEGTPVLVVTRNVGPGGYPTLQGGSALGSGGGGGSSGGTGGAGGAGGGITGRREDEDQGKSHPTVDVAGYDLEHVADVYIEETIGFELPYVRIKIGNPKAQLFTENDAREQREIKVMLGFTGKGQRPHGTYIVQRPKYQYGRFHNELVACIEGWGEAVKLGDTERRQLYEKKRDSDIATEIAARNGFTPDVEQTDPIFEQVIQANESDYKFLARRAKKYGYLLYCEDGTMHFHRPRPQASGIVLAFYSAESGQHHSTFEVQSRTFLRGAKFIATQIDPIRKTDIDEFSSEEADPIQEATGQSNWKKLVTVDPVGQPEMFLTEEGHLQQKKELKFQIDRMSQSTRFVIAGSGTAMGLHELRPNRLIEMVGVGRNSGMYYVTKTIHHVDQQEGGYKTTFNVVRTGAKEGGGGSKGTPVTLQAGAA